jgi:RHS repeat-associated protein
LSCNIASGGNGFQMTNEFLLGPAGNQVTEINNTNPANSGVWAWAHSNVWAGANLDATYDWMTDNQTGNAVAALHFHLSDPLGTRRVQTDPLGGFQAQFYTLPFGDQYGYEIYTANEHADDATEQHFTGKEHDTESGNDYFGARYYASSIGRWMSPDWAAKGSPVPYATFDDPQSLNLYQYARNNPLKNRDSDGHDCRPDCGAATPIMQAFQDIFSGKAFKDAASQAWDNAKSALGISGGQKTVANGTITLTGQVTIGNVTADTTGKQSLVIGPPDASAGVNASIHPPGQDAGPAGVTVSAGPVSVGATNNSVEVGISTSSDPKVTVTGSVDKDALQSGASTLAGAAKSLTVQPPPTPPPPPPPSCTVTGACK